VIQHRPFESLGSADHGWLKARHHFSFEAAASGWGALRIWNDDEISPDSGFPLHAHADMEIITYVREGEVSHSDSLGNSGHISEGEVQAMSAGTGIRHAEFNRGTQPTRIFQLWIRPTAPGGPPAWGAKRFPKQDRAGRLVALASGFDTDVEALSIRAKARVLGATLNQSNRVAYQTAADRFLYLVPAAGAVSVNGVDVDARDRVAITGVSEITIAALQDSEFVLVDAPPER
jgi:quercetin 2,3-dioxygenase